jgi:hypothetical protein
MTIKMYSCCINPYLLFGVFLSAKLPPAFKALSAMGWQVSGPMGFAEQIVDSLHKMLPLLFRSPGLPAGN